MAYAIEITTEKAPAFARCIPRFASRREAQWYCDYMKGQYDFIRETQVVETEAGPNARWTTGQKIFRYLRGDER